MLFFWCFKTDFLKSNRGQIAVKCFGEFDNAMQCQENMGVTLERKGQGFSRTDIFASFKKASSLMIANAYTMMTLLKMMTMLMVMFINIVRSMMSVRMMMKIRHRVACQTAVALSSDVNPQKAARACDRFVLVWLSCIIEVAGIIWLCMCFM